MKSRQGFPWSVWIERKSELVYSVLTFEFNSNLTSAYSVAIPELSPQRLGEWIPGN